MKHGAKIAENTYYCYLCNMHIHFVQHEAFEAPGAYLVWAEARGHRVSFSRVYEGDPLPEARRDFDMLIVMGGPQSPDTTRDECPHFDSKAEQLLIRQSIDAGKAVVGVCLGAQLIGNALGGCVERSPEKEIGVFPIHLTDHGLEDEKIAHFGASLAVGHWHADMPGIIPDSKVLAFSDGCPRQIIGYTERVYGFQCHLELTPETVELLIEQDETFLLSNTTHRFVQKPGIIRSFDFREMNERLFLFLDKLALA